MAVQPGCAQCLQVQGALPKAVPGAELPAHGIPAQGLWSMEISVLPRKMSLTGTLLPVSCH